MDVRYKNIQSSYTISILYSGIYIADVSKTNYFLVIKYSAIKSFLFNYDFFLLIHLILRHNAFKYIYTIYQNITKFNQIV